MIGTALALEPQLNSGGPSAIVGLPGEFFAQDQWNSGISHNGTQGGCGSHEKSAK